jgi:hypothetical protein
MPGPLPTGVKDFGTNEVFEGQQWGPFPKPNQPPSFQPAAWAKVNSDGTIASSDGRLTVIKGSAGNYIMMPAGALIGLPTAQMLAMAIQQSDVPAVMSIDYGLGPGSAGVSVVATISSTGTPTDLPFTFLLWSTGAP